MSGSVVIRGEGDRPGNDITDALLTAPVAQVERGRIEIDKSFSQRVDVSADTVFIGWVAPGSLVQVADNDYGVYPAQVMGITIVVERPALEDFSYTTSFDLEREEVQL
jgi:hypothetical protein